MNITADTPVDAVMNNRLQMVQLAQAVFDMGDVRVVRAFSQFRFAKDLASIIEAKRRGVFDYGALIMSSGKGRGPAQWPTNTKAILTAIDNAADGAADKIDWSALGDYPQEVQARAVFGAAGSSAPTEPEPAPETAASPAPSSKGLTEMEIAVEWLKAQDWTDEGITIAAIREGFLEALPDRKRLGTVFIKKAVAALNGDEDLLEVDGDVVRPTATGSAPAPVVVVDDQGYDYQDAPEPEPETSFDVQMAIKEAKRRVAEQDAPYKSANTDAILERVDKLASDLADAFDVVVREVKNIDTNRASVIEDELGYVKNEVENLKAGLVGVASYLDVVNTNLKKIGAMLDPYIEYETRPAEVDSMIQLSVPDDLEERLEEQKASAPVPPPIQEPPAPAEVSYSREDLQSMDLASLRDVAESLGVPNAHSIPYKTSLINKIVKLAV